MAHYSVTVINNGNRKWKFAAYQQPPDPSNTKSLAWFVSGDYVVKGDQIVFDWDINYQFVYSRKEELSTGVTFVASGHKNCDLEDKNKTAFTYKDNTPCLSTATSGGPTGKLTIVDGPEVPHDNNNNNTQKAALAKLPLTTHPHERAEPHTLQTQFTPACTTWPSPLPCETPDLPDLPTLPPTPATGPRSPAED